MRYVISGAGAIGSTLAAYLACGGEQVTIVDKNPARIRHLARDGITLSGFRTGGPYRVEGIGLESVRDLAPLETVLLCVKPYDMEAALSSLLPYANSQT